MKFQVEVTKIIEISLGWAIHFSNGGKDVIIKNSDKYNITNIKTTLPNTKLTSYLTVNNLQPGDGGHYKFTGIYRAKSHEEFFTVFVYGK